MQLPVTNYSHNESESSSSKSDNNSESDGYHSETESTDEQKYTNSIYSNAMVNISLSLSDFAYRNLIEEYNRMYKCLRLETLKSLSDTNNFHIAESVKLKILFSIVVVSMK